MYALGEQGAFSKLEEGYSMEMLLAYDRLGDVLTMVKEYTNMILEQGGDDVRECLNAQHLNDELADIRKKYALPTGRLYLLLVDSRIAGCVGLTRNDDSYCEIKRLYVRPEYRGQHLSHILISRIVEDAKGLGYKHMRLDTFPFMDNAIKLYQKYGFYYIERYNDNPAKTAVFMQLDLQ